MESRTLVVDASVAVKWLLKEEGHDEAVRILESYQEERLDLVAPYLLIPEVGNVLWKRVRRDDLTGQQAARCFELMLLNSPILLDSPRVNQAALELAMVHGHTVYDCLYLAWALEERCDLLTADERFFHAIRPAFSCIKLLKDFEQEE